MEASVESKTRIKGIINVLLMILGIGFLAMLFLFRGNMNNLVSKKMAEQAGVETKKSVDWKLDSSFNYQKNGKSFRITFLEFGATGCILCRKMEIVMRKVKEKYPESVNVRFYNVLLPENQEFMKFFGIGAIPTQVLLDPTGKEIFRHTGYISFDDLGQEFKKSHLL